MTDAVGPGPEPMEQCPVVREGMENEDLRKQVQEDMAAGRKPKPPLPPDVPPSVPEDAGA